MQNIHATDSDFSISGLFTYSRGDELGFGSPLIPIFRIRFGYTTAQRKVSNIDSGFYSGVSASLVVTTLWSIKISTKLIVASSIVFTKLSTLEVIKL